MIRAELLTLLGRLAQELGQSGRTADEAAIREALAALRQLAPSYLTVAEASARLNLPPEMIDGCVERGALTAINVGGCCWIEAAGVTDMIRLRQALRALDTEGNPTAEEMQALYDRRRQRRASSA